MTIPSPEPDGVGSGKRIMRNELNSPMSPARMGMTLMARCLLGIAGTRGLGHVIEPAPNGASTAPPPCPATPGPRPQPRPWPVPTSASPAGWESGRPVDTSCDRQARPRQHRGRDRWPRARRRPRPAQRRPPPSPGPDPAATGRSDGRSSLGFTGSSGTPRKAHPLAFHSLTAASRAGITRRGDRPAAPRGDHRATGSQAELGRLAAVTGAAASAACSAAKARASALAW